MSDSQQQQQSDWTYEKSWSSPKEVKLTYKDPDYDPEIDPKEAQNKTATFMSNQWTETVSTYQTITYNDQQGAKQESDVVTKRVAKNYLTLVDIAPNFIKWSLEQNKGAPPNKEFARITITEYTHEVTEDGPKVIFEKTTNIVNGMELIGALPIKDFRFIDKESGTTYYSSPEGDDVIAALTERETYERIQLFRAGRKKPYTRVTTWKSRAAGFTQEGQQITQALLKLETGNGQVSVEAYKNSQNLKSDGSEVTTSIGRSLTEQKPSAHEEAEAAMNEDPKDWDSATSASSTDLSDSAGGSGSDSDDGAGGSQNLPALYGNDLDGKWDQWAPFKPWGGETDTNTGRRYGGDPTDNTDPKPSYKLRVGSTSSVPPDGYIHVNSSTPSQVTRIAIGKASIDGFITDLPEPSHRIMIDSFSGSCNWWYLIKEANSGLANIKVQYRPEVMDSGWEAYVCRMFTDGYVYRAVVTTTIRRQSKVFDLPFAPDDFWICGGSSGIQIVPGNAPGAALKYLEIQSLIHRGETCGVTLTTKVGYLPSQPFAPVALNAIGSTTYGMSNGTTWAFNESGMVCSTDYIYLAYVGKDADYETRWCGARIDEETGELCATEDSPNWVEPPSDIEIVDLPVVTPIVEEAPKQPNTIETTEELDPLNLPCDFWTELLPNDDLEETPEVSLDVDYLYTEPLTPVLSARTRHVCQIIDEKDYIPGRVDTIQLRTRTTGWSDPHWLADYPANLTTRTLVYSLVRQPAPDGPQEPERPVYDCSLRVGIGFGKPLRLGAEDWPTDEQLVLIEREWETIYARDYSRQDDRNMPHYELPTGIWWNGELFNYISATTNGNIYFTDGVTNPSRSDYNPSPSDSTNAILPSASDKVCNAAYVQRGNNFLCFRFQGESYNRASGNSSLIWEITFHKSLEAPDPLAPQLIEFKLGAYDVAIDSALDGSQLPGSIRLGAADGTVFGSAEMVADTCYVITGTPDGSAWEVQANRHVINECGVYASNLTFNHVHRFSQELAGELAFNHQHVFGPTLAATMTTYETGSNRCDSCNLPDSQIKGVLYGMSFFFRSSYGFIGNANDIGWPLNGWRNDDPTITATYQYPIPLNSVTRNSTYDKGHHLGTYYTDVHRRLEPGVIWNYDQALNVVWHAIKNKHYDFSGDIPVLMTKGLGWSAVSCRRNINWDVMGDFVDNSTGYWRFPRLHEGSVYHEWRVPTGMKNPTWAICYQSYRTSSSPHASFFYHFGEKKVNYLGRAVNNYDDGDWMWNDSTMPYSHGLNEDGSQIKLVRWNPGEGVGGLFPYDSGWFYDQDVEWMFFKDDQRFCVTRFIEAGAEIELETEFNTGWAPTTIFFFMERTGFNNFQRYMFVVPHDESAIAATQWHCIDLRSNYRVSELKGQWLEEPGGRFALKITDTGLKIKRVKPYDDGNFESGNIPSRFMVSVMRSLPQANTTVGQFLIRGQEANFTYTGGAGYLSQPGEFVITGQELLKNDGVLPYPKPLLEVGQFEIQGQQIGGIEIEWLRMYPEAGEFELGGQVAQLIFCCYPDLQPEAGSFESAGGEVTFHWTRRIIASPPGQFVISGEAFLDYDRWLWMYPERGEFLLELIPNDMWLQRRIGAEAGQFILDGSGLDAHLQIGNGRLVAEAGEFLLEGFRGQAIRDPLAAEVGQFQLLGGEAGGDKATYPPFLLEAGEFIIEGQEIGDFRNQILQAAPNGHFDVFGQDAALLYQPALKAEAGAFLLNGYGALGSALLPAVGQFELRGQDAVLQLGSPRLAAYCGQFELQGGESQGIVTAWPPLRAEAGSFLLEGQDAEMVITLTGPWPEQVNQGFADERVGTGPQEYVYDQLPVPFTYLWQFPTSHMTAASTSGGWYEFRGKYDVHCSRIAGRHISWSSFTYGQQARRSEQWLQEMNETGFKIGVPTQRSPGTGVYTWHNNLYFWNEYGSGSYPDGVERYNHVWPDTTDITPEEARGMGVVYQMLFINLQSPALLANPNAVKGTREFEYMGVVADATGYTNVRLAEMDGFWKFGSSNYTYKPHRQWTYEEERTPWDAWNRIWDMNAFWYREGGTQNYEYPPDFRTKKDFLDDVKEHGKLGIWRRLIDERHRGLSIVSAGFNLLPPQYPYDGYYNEFFGLNVVPHGLDGTPDVILIHRVVPYQYNWPDFGNFSIAKPKIWGDYLMQQLQRGELPFVHHYYSDSISPDNASQATYLNSVMWHSADEENLYFPGHPMGSQTRDEVIESSTSMWERDYSEEPVDGTTGDTPPELPYMRAEPSMVAICIKNTPGYVMTGTISGDGSGYLNVNATFRPAFVLLKITDRTTAATAANGGLWVHWRNGDQLTDGWSAWQQQFTAEESLQSCVTWSEKQTSGANRIGFTNVGFNVPPGALGNDNSGLEVTWIAFAVERNRLQRLSCEPGEFLLGEKEIGGHKPDQIRQSEAGEFMLCECSVTFHLTRHEAGRSLNAEGTSFELRGGAAWTYSPVLRAEAGHFLISGETYLGRPNSILTADCGQFELRGGEGQLRKLVLKAETGVFRSTLQWAGLDYDIVVGCRIGPKGDTDSLLFGREGLPSGASRTDPNGRTWSSNRDSHYTSTTYWRHYRDHSIYFPSGRGTSVDSDYRHCVTTLGYISLDYYAQYDYTYFGDYDPYYGTVFLWPGAGPSGRATLQRLWYTEYLNSANFRGTGWYAWGIRIEGSREGQGAVGDSDFVAEVWFIQNGNDQSEWRYQGKAFIEVRFGKFDETAYDDYPWMFFGMKGYAVHPLTDYRTGEDLKFRAEADTVYLLEQKGYALGEAHGTREGSEWTVHRGKQWGMSCDVQLSAESGSFELSAASTSGVFPYPKLKAEAGQFALQGRAPGGQILIIVGWLYPAVGQFELSGGEAGGRFQIRFKAEAGSFALNGRGSSGLNDQILRAGETSFQLSGESAELTYRMAIGGAVGQFELQGGEANFTYIRKLRWTVLKGGFHLNQEPVFSGLQRHLRLSAAAGSFTIGGRAAGGLYDQALRTTEGQFQISGQEIGYARPNVILTAEAGEFHLLIEDAGGGWGRFIAPAVGQFELSGGEASYGYSPLLKAYAGSFQLTGQTAAFNEIEWLHLAAEGSNFELQGQPAGLHRSYSLSAEAGEFFDPVPPENYDGNRLLWDRVLSSAVGQFELLGGTAGGIEVEWLYLTAEGSNFELSGQEAGLAYTKTLEAEAGSFQLEGQAGPDKRHWNLKAAAGEIEVGGPEILLAFHRVVMHLAGAIALEGQPVDLWFYTSRTLNAEIGAFALIGRAAGYIQDQQIGANNGVYLLSGGEAGYTYLRNRTMNAEAGAFVLDGQMARMSRFSDLYWESWVAQTYGWEKDFLTEFWASGD